MWEQLLIAALGLFVVFKITLITYRRRRYPEPHEDWSAVDLDDVSFPKGFLWGTATAAHQVEGNLVNNWTVHEAAKGLEPSGVACDHWNRWNDDFQLLSDLGMTSYRFSIEWSRLEPTEGAWEEDALAVYSAMVDDLLARGIRPVVTLHHFSHPDWWEAKGGFAERANLDSFVAYCERVFEVLSDRVTTWVTINEPTVFSTMGYTVGMFPPGALHSSHPPGDAQSSSPRYRLPSLKAKNPDVRLACKNMFLVRPKNRWSPIDWPCSPQLVLEWSMEKWNQLGQMWFKDVPGPKERGFVGSTTTRTCWGLSSSPSHMKFQKRRRKYH